MTASPDLINRMNQAMDSITPSFAADDDTVLTVLRPEQQTAPVVFSSPHSGRDYPAAFVAASRLDPRSLRRSEDSFVEQLYQGAVAHGMPLLAARFPRAYCDVNREPRELDPTMFAGPLPEDANTHSPRVLAGLGTIPKVVASGAEIYANKLPLAEIESRLATCYRPYHRCLDRLLAETKARFGWSLLVDCHSMPSIGGPMDRDSGLSRVDVVLGDCYGDSCAADITTTVEASFRARGYRVVRNVPYAGGYLTRSYGKPRRGSHALQIELNRSLYMIEAEHRHGPDFDRVRADLDRVVADLAALVAEGLP